MNFLLPFLFLSFHSTLPGDSIKNASLAPFTVMSSDDGGNHWRDISSGLPSNFSLFTLETIGDQLYIGGGNGLYSASDPINPRWKKEPFESDAIGNLYQGKEGLYAISVNYGFYMKKNSGAWEPMHKNMKDQKVFDVIETKSGEILAGCSTGIFKSSDKGKTWQHVLTTSAAIKLVENEDVYLTCSKEGVWRSDDNGEHWKRVVTTPGYAFNVLPFNEGFIAMAEGQEFGGIRTPNEIFISKDKGLSWNTMQLPAELNTVNDIDQAGMILVASSQKGIFRSSDQGKTWKLLRESPADKNNFYKLVTSGNSIFAMLITGC